MKRRGRKDAFILSPLVLLHSIYLAIISASSLLLPLVYEGRREERERGEMSYVQCIQFTFCFPVHYQNFFDFMPI